MADRLVALFAPGDRVEIRFAGAPVGRWWTGIVVSLASPGVWVRTEDGQVWFVTNGRRIRPVPIGAQPPEQE
jgi:hypothetical protein